MRKNLLKISLVFAALLMQIGLVSAQNLLTNGDFETWSGGTPTGWTTIETGIVIGQTADTVHGGSNAMRVNCITATQGNTDFRQSINVTTGLTYDVSAWFYHIDTTLQVTIYAGGVFTNLYSDNHILNAWQQVTYSYTATTTGTVEFGLRFYDQPGFANSAIVYVDDYTVTQAVSLSPVITNISTTPTVPTESDNVNISADITDADGTISSAYLYWSIDNVTFDSIQMTNTSGDAYSTVSSIPAQSLGTVVYYYIKATDNSSNETATAVYSYNLSLLAPGDIAIVQYRTDAEDGFSFVVLKNFTDSIKIKFTDNAWGGATLANNESVLTWTAPVTGITAGTVVTWQNTTGVDFGTVTGTPLNGLSTSGDNIFAFTGDVSNPTFLFGLSTLPWLTTGAVNTNNSYLPANLTNGVNAIAFTAEHDNGFYNVTPISGDAATILASVCTESNWLFDDDGTTNPFQASSFWSITVGVKMVDLNSAIQIFPVPATSELTLSNLSGCDKAVISNMIGQDVLTVNTQNKEMVNIDLSSVHQGVYFISLYDSGRLIRTQKIIKK